MLLLGGYEIPSGIPAVGTIPLNQRVCKCLILYLDGWKGRLQPSFSLYSKYSYNHSSFLKFISAPKGVDLFLHSLPWVHLFQGMNDFSGRSIQPQRAASLSRFREKRKERCFDKKIRYNVRKEVALRYFIGFKFKLVILHLNVKF